MLESVVKHLREKGMRNIEVAKALGKHPNNTVTLHARAKDKLKKKGK